VTALMTATATSARADVHSEPRAHLPGHRQLDLEPSPTRSFSPPSTHSSQRQPHWVRWRRVSNAAPATRRGATDNGDG
jgi:hypothetical protein